MKSCRIWKLLSLVAFALTGQAAYAGSGDSKTMSGTVAANVVTPVLLTHTNGAALKFGKFSSSGTAGTVKVNALGAGSVTGGVAFVPGSVTATDRFRVAGEAGRQFTIVTGSGTVNLGASSMSFTTTPTITLITLPGSGVSFFDVGGTLSVNANQPGGNYSGTYRVTAVYN